MPIIDTPAEGFPLPTMTPPSRWRRDVIGFLSPGAKARAVQRADVIGAAQSLERERVADMLHDHRLPDLLAPDYARKVPTDLTAVVPTSLPVFDAEIDRRLYRRADAALTFDDDDPRHNVIAPPSVEAIHVSSFDAGRAYERGATLRRNVGAKSLGSRRVQAQGIAADYLRDDPQRGAHLAAMVLAGFSGAAIPGMLP